MRSLSFLVLAAASLQATTYPEIPPFVLPPARMVFDDGQDAMASRLFRTTTSRPQVSLIAVVLLSSLVGQWFRAPDPTLSRAMWWVHMVTVLGFLAYLPYSKHLHLLASPFGVFFASLEPGRVPDAS
ncbi:MAG: hypothetical protein LAQ69_45435, partial [Acidobacteriia bacterium]|nr:hypothetical protein [Terriglobia bacterium]